MAYINFLYIEKETEIEAFTDKIISENVFVKIRANSLVMDEAFGEAYEMYNGSVPFISMKEEIIFTTHYNSIHIPECDIDKFVECFKKAYVKVKFNRAIRNELSIRFSESVKCEVKRG